MGYEGAHRKDIFSEGVRSRRLGMRATWTWLVLEACLAGSGMLRSGGTQGRIARLRLAKDFLCMDSRSDTPSSTGSNIGAQNAMAG